MNFLEFQSMQNQTIYASATPAAREIEWARVAAGILPAVEPGVSPGGWHARLDKRFGTS
jgi:hypothetical protein